jgi:hypothetical protein
MGQDFSVFYISIEQTHLRHSGMRRLAQARNPYSPRWLWIPGSLAALAPRNDAHAIV